MKTKHIFGGAALVALSIFAVSCSSDETTTVFGNSELISNSELTSFVGTMASAEEPMTRAQVNSLYDIPVNTLNGLAVTRVTMHRDIKQNMETPGTYSWETGDYVYVKDDSNSWKKSSAATAGTSSNFNLEGTYSGRSEGYTVIYNGPESFSNDPTKITIAPVQTQTADYNKTDHLKKAGDCAIGKAIKNENGYTFKLTHKAAYLCILPYTTTSSISGRRITKVKVTSSAPLAGTYTISDAGLAAVQTSSNTVELKTQQTESNTIGLPISSLATNHTDATKGLYMVVAPSNGNFRVEVTLDDNRVISKTYPNTDLKANTVYNIPFDLNPEQSTTKILDYTSAVNNFKSGNGNSGPIGINQMRWYLYKGNPMLDETTQWSANGKTYVGGLWIKKGQTIMKENPGKIITVSHDGKVWSPRYNFMQNGGYKCDEGLITNRAKPTASELNNYFFLPFVGGFIDVNKGQSAAAGIAGAHWGSENNEMNLRSLFRFHYDSNSTKCSWTINYEVWTGSACIENLWKF